ncbi:MAG: hypothetical protein PUA84_01685 [Oscillospiraceae bacterium]|nr:hypothetical protein [Oscillospiraceae bacterium]
MALEPENKQQEDDIVEMIERLMSQGTGHVTVTPEELENGGIKVDTYRSMDCSKGNMACCQPTEFLDEE